MPSFFAGADALLATLRSEPIFAMTIPGKIQSYLAVGRPILAMLDGEGADLIARNEAGLVCGAGDSFGLAANVARMAAMTTDDRVRLADNARRLSDVEFNRDRLIGQLEQWLVGLRS